ncbi:MAG TPA: tetratricopeptide repeat protein [Chitinophagaceae bacterium]|nr:tetratricopeptide repeat protein [Chitinophagaceae bacterium]
MFRFVCFFILAGLFLAGCSGAEAENSLLRQPPFAALTDSIGDAPDNPGLYYRRGVLLYRNGQPALAQADLQRAWSLEPREEFALSLTTLLREKSPDSALQFLRGATQKIPGSLALQVGLARGYQQKGDGGAALRIADTIIARYPGQLDALQLRAELLRTAGRDGDALRTLEQAYRYAPSDAELAHNLAFAYAEANHPKALQLADSLIKADVRGQHAEPYYFKGVYFANTGQAARALAEFDEAIRRDYNFLDAHMDKGRLLLEQKKAKEALQAFQLAARITPTYGDAYFWTGKAQEALNQPAEAKLNYQRAYELDKSMTEARQAAERIR